jgi:hypothetical protein
VQVVGHQAEGPQPGESPCQAAPESGGFAVTCEGQVGPGACEESGASAWS